jgi:O-antigen ligase
MKAIITLERSRHYVSAALLVYVLILGGGGGPLVDIVAELLGIVLFGIVLARLDRLKGSGWPIRLALATAALIVLIPLAQLIPLPPTVWRSLSGRELAVSILDNAGLGNRYRPLSLDSEATWRATFYLVPAIALFLSVLQANLAERRTLVAMVVSGAILSMLLAVFQVTEGSPFYFYQTAHEGNAVGIFVNRNHCADMLLVGVALIPALVDWQPRWLQAQRLTKTYSLFVALLAAGLMILLALVVLPTISRAGTILMPLVLAVSLLRLIYGAKLFSARRSTTPIAIGVVALTGLGLIAVLALSGVAQSTFGRFAGAAQDVRQGYWRDTIYASQTYLPWGSGVGTFVPVYATAASLNQLVPQNVNHAHNDYLELALETGIEGGLTLGLFAAALLSSMFMPMTGAAQRLRGSAQIGIAILLAHSAVDYPLRTLCLIVIFGLLCGLMFAPTGKGKGDDIAKFRPL